MVDEIVMYLVVRIDLAMSAGKVGAQCGHGVQLALRAAEQLEEAVADLKEWEAGDYTKIVLGIKSEEAITRLSESLLTDGVPNRVVVDRGRTEIAPDSRTVLATIPMRKSRFAKTMLKRLQLYK